MPPLTRRSFLSASLAFAGAAAVGRLARAAAGRPEGGPGFRIFGCDWTLEKSCNPEAFPLARRIGLDGVQVDFGRPPAGGGRPALFDEALQDRILSAADREGVAVASLCLGIANDVPYKRGPAAEAWTLESLAVVRRMKQRVVLLPFFGAGDLIGDPEGTDEVIRRLRRLAPRAEEAGAVYGIESWLDARELERILDRVGSPAIRVYYDVGNMLKMGEDVGAAIRRLGHERICEVHLKDYQDLFGRGSTDFPAVRAALDAAGYRGWLGIEGVKTPLGVEASLRYDLEYLRPIFPKAA